MLNTTAIINLAHSLGIQVVSEGLETLAQLAFIKDQQCDVIQGVHFSKPLPVKALEQFVHEHNAPKANVGEVLRVVKRSIPTGITVLKVCGYNAPYPWHFFLAMKL